MDATQPRMLDVKVTPVVHEAEKYAELEYDIKQKQERLKAQAEVVMREMTKAKQRLFTYADEWGVKHRFEIIDSDVKLKHTKKGEPVE